jgi:alcohol dehydrogenase
MTEVMRAVVYDAYGSVPAVRAVPRPVCPRDGAVVRVEATGVCRSDWHAWRGHDPVPLPIIPGHEFAGVVAVVGPEVRGFAVGDRVTAPFVNGCGACEWCLAGQAQVCPHQTQPGFTHDGSFAEYVVVRVADLNLVRLPDGIDAVTAASLGCRFATAFRAVVSHAAVRPGEEVAVFGCGGVGLAAIMIACALGARVTAVDLSPDALSRAGALGAAALVRSETPVDDVVAATGGGAHVTIDALGSAATADAAVRSLRRQGRHVQVGLMLGDAASAPLPWERVIAWELRVFGSHGMAAADYAPMLRLIADGALDPARLVGRITDLDGAAEALMAMNAPAPAGAGIVVARI